MRQFLTRNLIIVVIVTLRNVASFLHQPEAVQFFKDYTQKYDIKSIKIFVSKDTDFSLGARQRFVSSLALPFVVSSNTEGAIPPMDASDSHLSIVYMDAQSDLRFLKRMGEDGLFRTMNWVIVGDPKTLSLDNTHSPYFALDNKVVFAKWPEESKANMTANVPVKIELFETYQASPFLPYVVNSVGRWTKAGGVHMIEGDSAARRTNLTGVFFRCVTLQQMPFTYLTDGKAGEETTLIKGYFKDVWQSLQSEFGFKYSCRRSVDNRWGTIDENGEWNGLVREVQDGSADVVVTSLDYTSSRAAVIDFLQGIHTVSYRMVVKEPSLMQSRWTNFTSELGVESWILVICSMIILPLTLVFVSYYSPFEDWTVPFQDAYLLTLGALFFQGSWVNVSSSSSRVVFITIFLATLLIYAHYTSALVAQLTVASDKSTPFTTLQGLLEDGGYNLGFKKDIAIEEYFRNAKSPLYKALWDDIISKDTRNLPSHHLAGLQKVRMENYVYLMESNNFNFEYYDECGLMMLPNDYFKSMTSMAFTKDSPYVKTLNYHLTKLRDAGVLERFWKRWQPPKSLCTASPFIALSIDQTFTAFLVLVFGLLLATCIILPIERLARSSKSNKISRLSPTSKENEHLAEAANEFKHPTHAFGLNPQADEAFYQSLTPRTNF